MKLCKYRDSQGQVGAGIVAGDDVLPLTTDGERVCLSAVFEAPDVAGAARRMAKSTAAVSLSDVTLLAPIDQQEVWAAGVTYKRSKTARMEESAEAASCYDRVYESPRPELFFTATPHRVAGPGQPIRIRGDARWSVPEPELTLVLNSRRHLVGFTIGNDMSSRDIEGENPLYLPQAKVYDACCGLGPWVTLASAMPPAREIGIRMRVVRGTETAFAGETSIAEMARSFEDLVGWLGRDNSFPHGVFLLTGTGIVPDSDFTLLVGDLVEISIDGIGTLSSPVVQSQRSGG
jgi:2-dehydro-3-deoxy-D-arabinonate dehydratase